MKSRIQSISLGIVIFLFFTLFISNETYASASLFFSLIASILVSACITQAIVSFKSFYHLVHIKNLEPEEIKDEYKYATKIFPIGVVILIVAFQLIHGANVEREFRNFGETGIAEIIDGSYVITESTRRFTTNTSTGSYQLKLRFNDKKGKEQIVFKEVDGSVFNKVGLGLKVPIVYSSKNINFIKVITDEKAYLEEYKKRIDAKGEENEYEELISNNGKTDGSRNINVADMMALDTLSTNNILEKLNNVSQMWENITDVSAEKWANSKRGEMIYKNSTGIKLSVFHSDSICSGVDPHKYLKYIGFREISKDTSSHALVRTFQHEDYLLTIKADKHPNDSNAFVIDYNLNRKHQSLTSK